MATLIEMTGRKYGRLTVVSRAENDKGGKARWNCVCDCGNETTVDGNHLRRGKIQSCGCLARELASIRSKGRATYGNLRHGGARRKDGKQSRIYRIWSNMKTRCFNQKNRLFKWYGALGVTICSDWMDFAKFRDWALSHGYTDELTIDRIDPAGNYCPENCRWIPLSEQRGNQRRSVKKCS